MLLFGVSFFVGPLTSVLFAAPPPEVHMLVPGFTVEELPVRLPNLNNVNFAPDGSMTGLGYNGKVWKIRDTDGDGLEDTATIWWDKAPLTVPVGMVWSTHGLIVSSSGKVSLLKDTNGDGVADTEEVVASGWPGKDVTSGNVDATGVTMDAEGNLYFGLLTVNYANPYRLKKVKDLTAEDRAWLVKMDRAIPNDPEEEVSLYDINSQRGTAQKWNVKTHQLETLGTGVRVPYCFAFNKAGDLFFTDQEGETWCPNGNPLDELNVVIRGHNYGFPPRHEKWLPGLVSNEPVVAFGPQHESSCGFVFNEPHGEINPVGRRSRGAQSDGGQGSAGALPYQAVALPLLPAQGLFGPKFWEGDAIVAGESRGKIWRVKLTKTDHGYTGEQFLIARLSMLTMDVAISPKGVLYVSCHSGLPDWGTGPNGEGKIFRIRYADPEAPQPVDVAAVSPTEVQVDFDKPIDPSVLSSNGDSVIAFGDSVRAAANLEILRPTYAVVGRQEAEPRGQIPITGWRLTKDNQRLIVETVEHPRRTHYAFAVSGVKRPGTSGKGTRIYLDYDLTNAAFKDWKPQAEPTATIASTAVDRPRGDFENGRGLFFGEQLKCSTCHRIRGEGAGHGPDLSNLASRDVASVLRDIRQPSATINPDYVGYNVRMRNDDEFTGFVRNEGNDRLKITSVTGIDTIVNPTDMAEMRPSGVSLMPEGLLKGLKESQINDLLTFLLNEPPKHSKADVRKMLGESETKAPDVSNQSSDRREMRVVLVASKQDHGKDQHDYPAWQKAWHPLLAKIPSVNVEDAWLWPTPDQFAHADAIIFYYWNHDWDDSKYAQIDAFQARGGGLIILHSATIEDNNPQKLAERIGLAAQPNTVKYRHTPFELGFVDRQHPITAGVPEKVEFIDEPYWPMIGDISKIHVLASAIDIDGEDRPMLWTFEKGRGRVFVSIAGHYTWTWSDPLFQTLVMRALDWVTDQHRFGEVALR